MSATVRILDQSYSVSCPQKQIPQLEKAAAFLDARAKEVRDNGKLDDTHQIIVMVALNICNELLHRGSGGNDKRSVAELRKLHARLDKALSSVRSRSQSK